MGFTSLASMCNQLELYAKIDNLIPKKKSIFILLLLLVTCFYLRGMYDALLSTSKVVEPKVIFWSAASSLKPGNCHRIYFHETSGKRSLDFRQTCAVESAAKENPDRPIQLFMQTNGIGLDDPKEPWLFILTQYSNIQIILINNETEYLSNTPLENWYRNGVWRNSTYKVEHFSDYIRILSQLRGGGGLYMDLDFITLQPLNERVLWNFLPFLDERAISLSQSIFHFEANHRLVDIIIQKLAGRYDPGWWAGHGPILITLTMAEVCGFHLGNPFSSLCNDVHILPSYFFYPISWPGWRTYFEKIINETMFELVNRGYGVHVWNKMSKGERIVLRSSDLYAVLASKHCPLAFAKLSEFQNV